MPSPNRICNLVTKLHLKGTMIECLIIENDKKVVEIIKTLGNDFADISFSSAKEDQDTALNSILKNKPELIFINIESPKINFLEFLFEITQCSDHQPSFIAFSSSKANSFEAYRYNFLDYLLKPLNEFSIRKSLMRFLKKNPIKLNETICLKSYKDYNYLNIDDILYLKADNNTTDFYMADGKVIGAFKTLKVFEKLLPDIFYRIHKSYIININCISRIHYGKSMCIITNQHKIPFTKTFITNINKMNKVLLENAMFTLS